MNQNHFEHNSNYSGFDQPTQTSIDHQPPKEISIRELLLQEKLHKALQAVCEKLNQQEQAANVSTHTPVPSRRFNIIYDYDDDDEENTIPLNEITSQIPPSIAIIPVSPTLEPEDSLIMEDEDLSTIPEKESDEFIKSSVEDLIPILSESEDTIQDDIDDDESLSNEDVPEDNVQIYSNPLFEFDDEYISSDIELLLHRDPSTPKISVASILEGFTDEPPLEENDDLFDLESKENNEEDLYGRLSFSPIDDLMTEEGQKFFDPIHEKIFSPTYVSLPFEDRHYFSLTYVIRFFLPYFTYPMDSSLPLSSGSEATIFDPGIPVFSLESVCDVRRLASSFLVFRGLCFISPDCPGFDDNSRARGFVHRSLDLPSLACLYMGIRYPRSY
ncbi:hypothetical protein Tco_1504707 [Tanacetum coccineum]